MAFSVGTNGQPSRDICLKHYTTQHRYYSKHPEKRTYCTINAHKPTNRHWSTARFHLPLKLYWPTLKTKLNALVKWGCTFILAVSSVIARSRPAKRTAPSTTVQTDSVGSCTVLWIAINKYFSITLLQTIFFKFKVKTALILIHDLNGQTRLLIHRNV